MSIAIKMKKLDFLGECFSKLITRHREYIFLWAKLHVFCYTLYELYIHKPYGAEAPPEQSEGRKLRSFLAVSSLTTLVWTNNFFGKVIS